MTRAELRLAMRRATLGQALKMLDMAFADYAEDGPSDEERQALDVIRRAYENTRSRMVVTGE